MYARYYLIYFLTLSFCSGCGSREFQHTNFLNSWWGYSYDGFDDWDGWEQTYGSMCLIFDSTESELYINSQKMGAEEPYEFRPIDGDTLKLAGGVIKVNIKPVPDPRFEWKASIEAGWPVEIYDGTVLRLEACSYQDLMY